MNTQLLRSRSLVFLDFDDVMSIPTPDRAGGYEVIHAMSAVSAGRVPIDFYSSLWDSLFDKRAVANLRALHDEFKPLYVLSTSWTRFLSHSDLVQVLERAGLSFVAESLHVSWETCKEAGQTRAQQVAAWLESHPEVHRWVALDDVFSGDGFDGSNRRVVMCEVGEGFTEPELKKAQAILRGELK